MTELEEAIRVANLVLDQPYTDPDADVSVLARQLLRALEREGALKAACDDLITDCDNWMTANVHLREKVGAMQGVVETAKEVNRLLNEWELIRQHSYAHESLSAALKSLAEARKEC